jgi:class 3 adenylate cyclase
MASAYRKDETPPDTPSPCPATAEPSPPGPQPDPPPQGRVNMEAVGSPGAPAGTAASVPLHSVTSPRHLAGVQPARNIRPARAGRIGPGSCTAAHGKADSRTFGTGAKICGLFAVDIVGFTLPHRDDDVQLHLHGALYRMLERAFNGSGLPWDACMNEDRGDGALVVVPPTISVDGLIDPLPERLRGLAALHNRLSSQEAYIQLRIAVHVGNVHHDGHGFVGDAVNHLFRLLDAPRLRQLLAGSGGELALIASDYVYNTVVRRHPTLVDPAAFRPVTVEVKQTTANAWVHIPGLTRFTAGTWPLGRPA